MSNSLEQHWDFVYKTKSPDEVSWTQETPEISLKLIESLNLAKDAKVIDVGGGDSKLVDELLALGYTDITVLDISRKALEKAKSRLGVLSENVTWIVSDINDFQPKESYDLWYDRAAFHFLISEEEKQLYLSKVSKYTRNLILGTFSDKGPFKCSGLQVQGYSQDAMNRFFDESFHNIKNITQVHVTPFGSKQDFVFGVYNNKEPLLVNCK